MSDSTSSETPDTPETPETAPAKPVLPAALQLQKDVKARVADLETGGQSASKRVIEAMAEEVMVQRVDVLTAALKKRRDLDSDLRKIKPDSVLVDEDGNEVMSSYTKGTQQALKKLRERLGKLDALLDAAIVKPTAEAYDKLSKHK